MARVGVVKKKKKNKEITGISWRRWWQSDSRQIELNAFELGADNRNGVVGLRDDEVWGGADNQFGFIEYHRRRVRKSNWSSVHAKHALLVTSDETRVCIRPTITLWPGTPPQRILLLLARKTVMMIILYGTGPAVIRYRRQISNHREFPNTPHHCCYCI